MVLLNQLKNIVLPARPSDAEQNLAALNISELKENRHCFLVYH